MTPTLKGVRCAEVADLAAWTPDSDEICLWLELSIGPPDGGATDLFKVCIASRLGLKSAHAPKGDAQARPIVLREYSWGTVLGAIRNRLESCGGADWPEIQQKLRRQFDWKNERQKGP